MPFDRRAHEAANQVSLASQKLIDKAVLDDKTVYPDAATMAKLYTISARKQPSNRRMMRVPPIYFPAVQGNSRGLTPLYATL